MGIGHITAVIVLSGNTTVGIGLELDRVRLLCSLGSGYMALLTVRLGIGSFVKELVDRLLSCNRLLSCHRLLPVGCVSSYIFLLGK